MSIASPRALRFPRSLPAALWILLACGCTAPAPQETGDGKPVLRVGVTSELAPMIFKEGGRQTGMEAELAQMLAESCGRTVKFVEVPWDKQIDALLAGKTDIIMSSMTITTPRAMRVNFVSPYLRAGQVSLVRRADASRVRLLMGSERMRVGVQAGTTGDYYVQQSITRAERVQFSNPKAGAKALVDGKIDVFINDGPVNWWLAALNEDKGLTVLPELLTEEYLGWAVRKEDAQLLADANKFVETIKTDGRLAGLIRRWLPYAR